MLKLMLVRLHSIMILLILCICTFIHAHANHINDSEDGKDSFYTLKDGAKLRYLYYKSNIPNADTALIFAGKSVIIEKYHEFVEEIHSMGLNVLVFEWRGHGKSSRMLSDDSQKCHIDNFSTYLDDFHQLFTSMIIPYHKDRKLFVIGISMGGMLATQYVTRYGSENIDGLVLLAPSFDVRTGAYPRSISDLVGTVSTSVGLGDNYIFGYGPYDPDTDIFEQNTTIRDKTTFEKIKKFQQTHPELVVDGPTFAWGHAMLQSVKNIQKEIHPLNIPSILISAGDDTLVNNTPNDEICAILGCVYTKTYMKAKHELIHEPEPERSMILNDIEQFYLKHVK